MHKTLLYLLLLSQNNALKLDNPDAIQRITNGVDAPEGKFPFLVSILQKEDHACGGTIVSKKLILTAAHCCFDLSNDQRFEPKDLAVSVGSVFWKQGVMHKVKQTILHEQFSLGIVGNDVAMLVLASPIEYSTNVRPVKMNPVHISTKRSLKCVVAGWGYRIFHGEMVMSTDHQLQYVEVLTIPFKECTERLIEYDFNVQPVYICVYTGEGKGTCNADSGGPLIYEQKQIGILSLGIDCNNTLPEFYTRISDYYSWIRQVERKVRE